MLIEMQNAINWALQQKVTDPLLKTEKEVTKDNPQLLVDKVREYFNINNIPYETFSYDDLLPFLN